MASNVGSIAAAYQTTNPNALNTMGTTAHQPAVIHPAFVVNHRSIFTLQEYGGKSDDFIFQSSDMKFNTQFQLR
jgi:hypothetical protein